MSIYKKLKHNAIAEVPDASCSLCGDVIHSCIKCKYIFDDDDKILCMKENGHICEKCIK